MKNFIFLLLIIPATFVAQELDARITINYEQLSPAYKEKLDVFQRQMETYLNNTKFTENVWEWERIKCSFNIFFTSASDETKYAAQIVVTSQRKLEKSERYSLMLSVMDNTWKFVYEKNQSLYFNQTDFEPLTSLLDFYAYLIIGLDADSYEPFAGSAFFSEALNIAVIGSNTNYADSWAYKSTGYNKRALVEDLMDANYQSFRQDFYEYHYIGLDLYTRDKNKTFAAMKKMIVGIKAIKKKLNKRSILIETFFDAKSGELIEYFTNHNDKSIFEDLIVVDPGRVSKYIEASNK
ncbi:MAG: DUF4835 family protein [Bacteroidetes bacterium]|nr:DUF4835 family protein [Bacteroidota bacterium]MBU1678837.1 DUF4835 family protein [Bacteroidota bacterium]MBU2507798.1 DUF4835 family protein [Bacteroidota bacterium]